MDVHLQKASRELLSSGVKVALVVNRELHRNREILPVRTLVAAGVRAVGVRSRKVNREAVVAPIIAVLNRAARRSLAAIAVRIVAERNRAVKAAHNLAAIAVRIVAERNRAARRSLAATVVRVIADRNRAVKAAHNLAAIAVRIVAERNLAARRSLAAIAVRVIADRNRAVKAARSLAAIAADRNREARVARNLEITVMQTHEAGRITSKVISSVKHEVAIAADLDPKRGVEVEARQPQATGAANQGALRLADPNPPATTDPVRVRVAVERGMHEVEQYARIPGAGRAIRPIITTAGAEIRDGQATYISSLILRKESTYSLFAKSIRKGIIIEALCTSSHGFTSTRCPTIVRTCT